ncbi:MAG: hypothetical protein AB7U73_03940 [Pirellulales bacterium]
MRSALGGALVCAMVLALAWMPPAADNVAAQQMTGSAQAGPGSLIALSHTAANNRQQVTIIDPVKQVMSVYHIEPEEGTIELKSVRKIAWDMEMVQFNGTTPLPADIHKLLEQSRTN